MKASLREYGYVVRLLILGMALLFVDFATKAYAYHILPLETTYSGFPMAAVPVFRNVMGIDFAFVLALNRGAAWGLLAHYQIILLILRIAILFALFVYLFFMNKNRAADLPLVLILSGALGNVIDFFLYGSVVDFLQFTLWGYHFPTFNVADTAITIGVVWLICLALFSPSKKSAPK